MTRATYRNYWSALIAFALAAALIVAPPHQTARAASLLVCPVGDSDPACDYNTLAAAVSDAFDGDDITLKAGTYDETAATQWINKSLTVTGAGSGVTIIDGSALGFRVMNVWGDMNVAISGLTITGGSSGASLGGAISFAPYLATSPVAPVVTLTDVEITGNSSETHGGGIENNGADLTIDSSDVINNTSGGRGGGIYNFNGGSVTLIDSAVSGNTADTRGGGIYSEGSLLTIVDSQLVSNTAGNVADSIGGRGAGIYVDSDPEPLPVGRTAGTEISGSTLHANTAIEADGAGGEGGGIYIDSAGTIVIVESTISGNTAQAAAGGAGIYTASPQAVIQFSTIVQNIAAGPGGGIVTVAPASNALTITGTILAGNTGTFPHFDCYSPSTTLNSFFGPNLLGVYADANSCESLSPPSPSGTPAAPLNPGVQALADYGGPTPTHAIIAGTPAHNAAGLTCGPTDQRGVARPQGPACDIGSFELEAATPLQDLIDAAGAGATVVVPAGTYNENITIGGGKTLQGAGIGSTIIDGGGADTTVRLVGDAVLEDLTITGGFSDESTTTGGVGGGVHVDGDPSVVNLTLNRVEVTGNDAGDGAGIYANSANVTINDSEITSNDAAVDGGGFIILNSTAAAITGTEFSANTAGGFGGGFYTNATDVVTITDSVFTGNSAGVYGGAALLISPDATVTGSNFTLNSADIGGAIYNDSNLVVETSTFASNTATVSGGAMSLDFGDVALIDSTVDLNTAPIGGGVYANVGTLTVSGSTISNNTATSDTGTSGGGIGVGSATVDISNSTLSGNNSAGNGGGLGVTGGTAVLNNVTLANNTSAGQGAALNGDTPSTIYISNSLSGGNNNGDGGPNCDSLVSLGHNVLGGNPGGCELRPSDIIGPALIGPLADNGGPTQTHALAPTSPGIDAGNTALAFPASTPATELQLNGNATAPGGLDLISANGQVGSAFWSTPVDLAGTSFETSFTFQITDLIAWSGYPSADGLTFAIVDSPTSVGIGGGELGLGGLANSVAIEFDTFDNNAAVVGCPCADPSHNHIGIDIGGNALTSPISANVGGPGVFDTVNSFDDGNPWTATVSYDAGTDLLTATVSSATVAPVTIETTVDIAAVVGPTGYFGFTSSAGAAGARHTITSWEASIDNVCEPTDQRGISRPQLSGCDIGAFELEGVATSLSVDISDAGAIGFDDPIIQIEDLDISTFFGVPPGPSSTQLGAIQLGAIQLGAIDSSGLTAAGGYLTIGAIIDAAAELAAVTTILDEITLDDVPVAGGWEQYLDDSPDLIGRPPYTVTLQQAIDDSTVGPQLPDLRLADSGVAASQLGAIQLGAIQLGAIQLGAIQLGAIQLGAIGDQLQDICGAGDTDCTALGIDPADPTTYEGYSIMALTLLGVDLDFAQLGAIQLGAIDPSGTQLGAIQLGAIQLGAIDTAAGTIGNTQLGAIQLGAIQLGAIQLGAIQLGAIGSKAGLVDYWCNNSASNLDCAELGVDPAGPFAGDELDAYSIIALGAMGADLDVLQLGAIELGAIANLESTQLGAIQLGAIQLGAIDPAATQLGAIQLGAIGPGATQLGAIQLGAIDFNNPVFAQLGAIQLGAIQLGAIQLGAIQLGAISDPSAVVNCGALAGGCSANGALTLAELESLGLILPTANLEDLAGAMDDVPLSVLADLGLDIVALVGTATLLDLLPETTIAELPPELTLGELDELWVGIPLFELLLALMDPADLSWEDVDPLVLAAENPVLRSGWSVTFELTGTPGLVPGAEFPFSADVSVTLPAGVEYIPGTAALAIDPATLPPPSVPLPDPTIDGSTLRWIIDGVDLNESNYIEFELSTSFATDASVPIATSVSTLGYTGGDALPTIVSDLEPNDTFAEAVPIEGDVIVLGRVDSPGDLDMFRFDVPAGGTIEAYLNPGGQDLDLVLFEPGATTDGELRGPAERVVDGSLDPTVGVDPTEQDQESLDDIPNTGDTPVFTTSLHRDDSNESFVTPPLREGGAFFLQVSGYNQTFGDDIYVGRFRVIPPPAVDACSARLLPFTGTPGALPSATELAAAETIYLWNQELFGATYGSTAVTEVLAAITAVNGVPGAPQGVVIPVEGDVAVKTAYDNWLSANGNCSTAAANGVATSIAALVDDYRDTYPGIASVVVIGGDDQVPFFRVKDQGTVANERSYLSTFSGNNPLVASLRDGMVLSDSPYVDANPLYVEEGDREIFVPELPIGRLVEEPVEIVAALNQYVVAGGLLATATDPNPEAYVLGYDFLADSSGTIRDNLIGQQYQVTSFINEMWTRADIDGAVDSGAAVINGNAHYDHTAALPAAGNLSGELTDLYTVEDLEPVTDPASGLPNNLYLAATIYTMGCHAGLNAPGSYLSAGDDVYDWAQALLHRGALSISNTGFGFGDSEYEAYSERLMSLLTEQFATTNTIGEAHALAAQLFAAGTPKWSPYHDKALMEATLYGLPFYRLHVVPVTPPAIPTIETTPVTGSATLQQSGPLVASAPVTEEGGPTEDRYLVADDVLAVPFRPVQPVEYLDVTADTPGLTARGAIIESGSTTDLPDFDVLYARPILFDEDAEPEFETTGAFPNSLQAVTSYQLPNGRADRLIVSRGRYFPSSQTQQRWDEMGMTVYYAPDSVTDIEPAQITRVSGVDQGNGDVVFEVEATDPSGILRVVVLYKPDGVSGAWTALELQPVGGIWQATVAGLAAGPDIGFSAQVLAGDGTVASSTDKAELHEVLPPAPPTINVTGTTGNNGIYVSAATVELEQPANAPNAALEISTNGGLTFDLYTDPVSLADGQFDVIARPVGFVQSAVSASVQVDVTAPTVTVVSPGAPVPVALGATLPLQYVCGDPQPGSGVAKCLGTVINGGSLDTTQPGVRVAQVTATDRAGNVTTELVPYEVVAEGPLVLTADTTLVAEGATVTFTAEYSGADQHTIEWWFGDGGSFAAGDPADASTAQAAGPALQSHPYVAAGVYPVTVQVTHESGLVQTATLNYIVVYNPSDGFVTGGGWIDSPPGAYTPQDPEDPDITGRADFGFVSKYKKGQTVPTGNTAFEFEAGGLDFSSTSYDWLVVQGGGKAAFKGVGVIAGAPGEFKFRVTIWDADVGGDDYFEVDRFRIQIWTELPSGDDYFIYDNGYGVDPDEDPQGGGSELGGGSIVIHVPKGGKGGK